MPVYYQTTYERDERRWRMWQRIWSVVTSVVLSALLLSALWLAAVTVFSW